MLGRNGLLVGEGVVSVAVGTQSLVVGKTDKEGRFEVDELPADAAVLTIEKDGETASATIPPSERKVPDPAIDLDGERPTHPSREYE